MRQFLLASIRRIFTNPIPHLVILFPLL